MQYRRTHRDLEVWRQSVRLAELVYKATAEFPDSEKFGLSAQMRRAAVSVISNVAEGAGRDSTREFARFVSFARASIAELEAQFELALRLQMLQSGRDLDLQLRRTGQMLSALHRTLRTRLRQSPP